jgi:predicted DNA-binding transcriptional regulator AlpA
MTEQTKIRPLKTRDVAERLGVTHNTLSTWRKKGVGPRFIQINERTVRYMESDVADWQASKTKGGEG